MAHENLPAYLASAQPNPLANRAPWYKNTAQSYAGIFLWIAFYDQLGGTAKGAGALGMAGLGTCLLALVLAGLISYALFYFIPGMLGMKTGFPLYIVGTSTFGTKGGYFLPGIFMGLLQIGWYSVATYFAADLVLRGLGLEEYNTTILGAEGKFSLLFVVTAVVWGYLFALFGALGIGTVAKMATFFPIVPIVMLIVAAGIGVGHLGGGEAAASQPAPAPASGATLAGFLLIIQLVIGFFATAGAVGADFCSNNRNVKDVRWGGIVGIGVAIVFAGGLALIAVAGAHAKDPSLTDYTFSGALPVLNTTMGRGMLILFAIGSVAPACFCSFIIGNSLSTMLARPKARVPITLAGATIGIILAALGVAGNLAPFFGLIGASFGPVIGAMIADYALSGGQWRGPREGVNVAGYAAWLIGFLVGISNNDLVTKLLGRELLGGCHATSVYSLVVGFCVYVLLAKAGLEPRPVALPAGKSPPASRS